MATKNEIQELNLLQRLAKIREIAEVVSRSKKGFNYTYADLAEILAKVTAGMKKYHVSLLPSIVPETAKVSQETFVNTKFDKQGHTYDQTTTEMVVTADMVYRWVNDDNPDDKIDVSWFVTGMQPDPSQAFGTGLSYCERYFLCNYFQIAQPEDVDKYRSDQKLAAEQEEKVILDSIKQEIDNTVRTYLSDNPKQAEEVKQFMANYDKKSNYLAIKDIGVASKLLEDFRNKFLSA